MPNDVRIILYQGCCVCYGDAGHDKKKKSFSLWAHVNWPHSESLYLIPSILSKSLTNF